MYRLTAGEKIAASSSALQIGQILFTKCCKQM